MSFTIPNVSIAGTPTIEWRFTGDVAHAECAGAKAYAETRSDGCADLRITDAAGVVLAEIIIRRLPTEKVTVSLMNVGSALLWSHARWVATQTAAPATDSARTP